MKTIPAIASIFALSYVLSVQAGPVRDMTFNHPEQIDQIITTGSYNDLLTFITSAYQESQQETDGITQNVYMYALDRASSEKQVRLATDFSLIKSDMTLKTQGASAIASAVLSGTTISADERKQAKAALKTQLQKLSGKGQLVYDFAEKAATALIVLGDDAGLDIFLTDVKTARNYSLKDQWIPTSSAALFQQLRDHYTEQATASGKDWDKVMAATYELCRTRRVHGIEVRPIQLLINLESLSQ